MLNVIIIAREYTYYDNAKLRSCYCNARITCVHARGHKKEGMNKIIAKDYARELSRRETDVPTENEVDKYGVFNGDGSW